MQKNKNRNGFLRNWRLYAMFMPAAILLIVFCYMPMYGIVLAFKDFNPRLGILGSEWIGLVNFKEIFGDPYFKTVLTNTLKISILKCIFSFPVPIILALLLNEVKHSGFKRVVQTVSYLPHFISWVIISGILVDICSIDGGIVTNLIENLTGVTMNFFGNSNHFIALLVVSEIWKGAGWGTIIYFAAISGVDPALYEASLVDGANRFQRMRYITLPALVPAIGINLIFTCSSLLSAGFDQIFNLYNPVVYEGADIIDTYIYRIGVTNGNYGTSTALGLFNSVIGITLLLTVNKIIKKMGGSGIW